jgi:cysteinyl-tRNA synthetase
LRAPRTAAADVVPAAFLDALMDDINTPKAQSELFALAKAVEAGGASAADLLAAGRLMGFLQTDPEEWFMGSADDNLKAKVDQLLAERFTARQSKDFATADRIRGELDALGVIVMDSPQGATWRMKD